MVESYPDASGLSLQVSNIIDELGAYAQWMLGKERSSQIFKKGQTLNDLINFAKDNKNIGRNQARFKAVARHRADQMGDSKEPMPSADQEFSSKATFVRSLEKIEQDYNSGGSDENDSQNVTLEDLIAVTYQAEETFSFTNQIKDLIKEDGGNDNIPESDRHSSEYFEEQTEDVETEQTRPRSIPRSTDAIYAETGKPIMTTNEELKEPNPKFSETLLEKELCDLKIQQPVASIARPLATQVQIKKE